MKFSQSPPVVNPNTIRNVPMQVSRDINVYGGKGGGEMWGALANAAKIGLAMQQKVIDGKTLEANAEYNRLMSEGTSALMQKKEGEALHITDEYDKLQKDVLADVRKRYGNYIGFGAGAEAFNAYTMRDDATRREHMVKYQMGETEKYQETQFNNQLAACQQFVMGGGGSDQAIEEAFNRGVGLLQSRYANYGPEKIKEQERAFKGQLVSSALALAVGTGDYVRMGEISSKYNDVLDAKTRVSVLSMLGKRQKEAHELAQANDLWAKFGNNATREDIRQYVIDNAKNLGGLQGLFAKMESLCGVEMDNGRNGCVEYSMKALAQFCKFGADNAAQRNVGNLCRAAQAENSGASLLRYDGQRLRAGDIIVYATPGDDISNFDNLEHVTVSDGNGGYYGNSSGARDYEDENGNYVKGNGCGVHSDDQEIGGYEIAYIIRPDDMQAQEMTDLDIEEQTDKLWAQYEKKYQQARTMENRLIEQGQLKQQDLINQGVEDPDAFDAIANEFGIIDGVVNERVLITLQKQGGHIRNILAKQAEREAARESGSGGRSGKKENDPMARIAIRQMLESGIPLEEILEHIDEHNYSDGKSLIKMCFDYKGGKGEFAVDWKPLKSKAKAQFGGDDFDAQWALAQDYAYEEYKRYQASHGGEEPTQKEMESWLFDGLTHPEYTTQQGTLWDSTEKSALSNAEWYNRGVKDVFYNPNTRKYNVTLVDGGTYQLTPEQYKAIVEDGKRADQVLFGGYE